MDGVHDDLAPSLEQVIGALDGDLPDDGDDVHPVVLRIRETLGRLGAGPREGLFDFVERFSTEAASALKFLHGAGPEDVMKDYPGVLEIEVAIEDLVQSSLSRETRRRLAQLLRDRDVLIAKTAAKKGASLAFVEFQRMAQEEERHLVH